MALRKIKGGWDVRCAYYTRTSHVDKGEQVVIYFNEGLEALIDSPRATLVRDGSKLMFKPVEEKVRGSFAISEGRIQVTTNAKDYAAWAGLYATLRHDDTTNWYYIDLNEANPDTIRQVHKSSPHPTQRGHAYTPYVEEDPDVAANIRVANDETLAERDGYQPTGTGKIDCRLPKQYRLEILMNMLIDFVIEGAIEPAKQVAEVYRRLK